MKIAAVYNQILNVNADLLVVDMAQDKKHKNKLLNKIDLTLKKEISAILKNEKIKGAKGEAKLIYTRGKLKADYLLIMGLGDKDKCDTEVIRRAGAVILSTAQRLKAKKVVSVVLGSKYGKVSDDDCALAMTEGFLLAGYKYTRYIKKAESSLAEMVLYCRERAAVAGVNKAVNLAQIIHQGVVLARDLVNDPANLATPRYLALAAKKLKGVKVRVHGIGAIKKLKMGAFLSVAQGSTANPPYFIEMHYRPKARPKKKIAFIGKGVTFDTGGYSIKLAKSMETMKDDKAGAAAVMGLMSVISKLQPKVEVSAYIAATENMVDGFAQRPGDICKSMSGKTIEVLNTDAEGRLTLADAMTYALKKKPDYLIDIATLTGACLVALGSRCSAVLGNDQDLIDKLIKCGRETGEMLWQLPIVEDYRDDIKTPIADMKNNGASYAGTITAAIFLENFVGKTKWAHLDIAGTSWTSADLPYTPKGGTGVMVRTFARLLSGF
ncbi:MAG: leucyl aminopeptidase [Deltaproteobacteria bacterium]|nr:leucyl aminopeptidase [Deltaproteobacteria bacterium]